LSKHPPENGRASAGIRRTAVLRGKEPIRVIRAVYISSPMIAHLTTTSCPADRRG
jgi:hypothetical protein